jgi:hypothetical protein
MTDNSVAVNSSYTTAIGERNTAVFETANAWPKLG